MLCVTRQRFQRWTAMFMLIPKVVASSNLGLELANAFGVHGKATDKRLDVLANAFGVYGKATDKRLDVLANAFGVYDQGNW